MRARSCSALVALALAPASAAADEGQWPPAAFAALDAAALKAKGLALEPSAVWSKGGGLARAAVNYGGCSAAFVSPSGLIATNHHCAYRALQAASTVDHDYLRDGFVAETAAEELPAKGRGTVWVIDRIVDVTEQVRAAIDGAADDGARRDAADARALALAQACEAERPGYRCEVKSFFFGARWERHELLEIEDVRLVYAPPSAIGEYGGEIDNWMWPRHSGDVSLLRAYVGPDGAPATYAADNVPYRPTHVLEVGADGVREGDFVAVLGYPGHTDRYLWASALTHHVQDVLPARIELYGTWLEILEAQAARDRATALKVAALKKGLANVHKNSRGMLAGIRRMGLRARRDAEAEALAAWANEAKDVDVKQALLDLDRITKAGAETFARDHLLESVERGPRLLGLAIDLVRLADARQRPEAERRPRYQTRNLPRLKDRLERVAADYDLEVEAALLISWLRRAEALPAPLRVAGVANLAATLKGSVEDRARALLLGTSLHNPKVVTALFEQATPATLASQQDALLRFARTLAPAYEVLEDEADGRAGVRLRVAPHYRRAVAAVREGPVYPDANGTLRVSYARVRGYAPKDGLRAVPFTTLGGQVAKHTGEAPFDLPDFVRAASAVAPASPYAAPALEDVPVCFLSDADTTGGNSGSPVIDGRGRWVGLNFDRVWENIAGDVAYNPPQSRNIAVDVRYVLWLLSETPGAERVLDELGVPARADAPRRAAVEAEPDARAAPAPSSSSSSCRGLAGSEGPAAALAVWGLWGARRRRRGR